MKKLIATFLCASVLSFAQAQDKCATGIILQQALEQRPDLAAARAHYREHAIAQAELFAKNKALMKTTQNEKIPVVFHVILTTLQINQLGGTSGVLQRAIDQINVLNEDYNEANADAVKVPAAFVPLQGSIGITFGLAHRRPDGSATNGVEITTTTLPGFSAYTGNGELPKYALTGGADAWDPTKYLNIWVVNASEPDVLGYAIPPSYVSSGFPLQEIGVVLDYGAFGRRGGTLQFFSPSLNDRGRTATHEVGHFFELEHNFGGGPGCPGSGDVDDGIADTPPQDGPVYGNPMLPQTDACSPVLPGIMWMNFMDYTNDSSMYMFTQGQANFIQSKLISGILLSLTQHPELLDWPTNISTIEKEETMSVFPNPASGKINISFTGNKGLQRIDVLGIMGQIVHSITVSNSGISSYNVDLSGLHPGVYMVRCTFVNGVLTKKIVLQ